MRALWLVCCLLTAPQVAAAQDAATELSALSAGSWTSLAQSAEPHYDWVESETVRILTDRSDGVWLYQENAVIAAEPDAPTSPEAKDKPYFQVVIHLVTLGPGEVLATTYRLATPEARLSARGHWARTAQPFDPDWIGEAACMSRMQRVASGFWQGGAECPNNYKDAVKVDSRTLRTRETYVNWDRGFNAEGERVWGPADGGYIFTRKESNK